VRCCASTASRIACSSSSFLGSESIQKVQAQIAPQRLLYDFAVALSLPGRANLDQAKNRAKWLIIATHTDR
jgi:hypothetical protein